MEMRFLIIIQQKVRLDEIRNTTISQHPQLKPIQDTIRERQLQWFGMYVVRRKSEKHQKGFKDKKAREGAESRSRKMWIESRPIRKEAEKRGIGW